MVKNILAAIGALFLLRFVFTQGFIEYNMLLGRNIIFQQGITVEPTPEEQAAKEREIVERSKKVNHS